ncbi:MAG: EthD domain-containing protein [Spirochaetaceae bacterium]|nr:EthD domain-containing protein [Spirochaetaceae bacterium]
MIRTLGLIKRRADLDRAAFREHYESVHAPLALPHMTGLLRYVRYHVESELFGRPPFDVVSAFWYRDKAAIDAVFATLEGSEAGAAIRADELTFMDKPGNRILPVSERRIVDGEEGDEHFFLFVRRPTETARFDASARLYRDRWPSLVAAARADWALLRDGFPMGGGEPVWDSVLQLRTERPEAVRDAAVALDREGYEVVVVATRRCETPIPAGAQ